MIIMGIDPGLALAGWGVIQTERQKLTCLGWGVIETPAGMPSPRRLMHIYEGIGELMERFHPEAVAVEELFFNTNVTTAIQVAQARGAILTAVGDPEKLFEYTPLQVKQTLSGYGRADKKQMQQMVRAVLKLDQIPRPDDAADGLALAICHHFCAAASAQFKIR